MNYKGTKSEQNMKAALTGESLARNKYTYYAIQASQEGYDDVAEFFDKMADNEREHAKIWFKMLNNGLGETSSNLQDAAAGENYEWKSMYPQFAADARTEGFETLATMFEKIAAIENDHEKRFLEMFLKFKMSHDGAIHKAAPASPSTVSEAEQTSGSTSSDNIKYRCMFCGHLEDKRLDVCPVCEAIGAFELIK